MKRKILITGGAGFIASHLIERLIENNEIVVFDNYKRNALQESMAKAHKNLKVCVGDIGNMQELGDALADCDTVIHCAAIAGIDSVGKNPVETMRVNLIGTYNLLELAKEKRLKNFIHFSTSEVYGPNIYKGTEDHRTAQGPIGQLRWTYSVSKLASEYMAIAYHQKYGMPVTSIRPFNVYGPRQVGEGAIQQFIFRAIRNEDIFINGDGSQIRAWCYVSDFADGIIRCLNEPKAIGEVFNLGTPQTGISTLELAHLVIGLARSSSKICFKPSLEAEVEVRVPSIEKAKKLLGFNPQVDLRTGIHHTLAGFNASMANPQPNKKEA